ncbi:non-ribosomal peptide synthetase [Xanthomonas sacchari]|uniref:non-ribosomal peptide synthetase n=1 Tax=Xanthomonas sacchari TaxID=56458 RepID=UPI0022589383|nr:non-ribosomal peptide synthetase [Xanthomonas sacchari]
MAADHGVPADGNVDESSLLERFAAQVARTPDAVALIHEDTRVTYRELHERATQLALHLQHRDIGPGCIVGLCVERSPRVIIGVLGILQAGAAYLPIDPRTPGARIVFMVNDCRATALLTDGELCIGLETPGCTIIRIDRPLELPQFAEATLPQRRLSSGALAYVIYTSGSTGQPKGVLVPRSNVTALLDASQARFRFGPQDVWTLFHSYAFDFSVWEMWGALLYGGRLIIVSAHVSRNTESFYELVSREGVTVLNQTPSAFAQFIAVDEIRRLPLQLRLVIFGGEALRFGELRHWFERHSDRRPELVNMYGITETTVHVTQRGVAASESVQVPGSLIGNALPHLRTHVLDESMRPVEEGVPGELYVSGAGLAWGYFARASLTASRFVASPFVPGERLYRSGDLVRCTSDGELEYLGRIDQQVKLRGFRIELGEIEAALLLHAGVRQAVAIARESEGEQQLVAYVVPTSVAEPDLAMRVEERVGQWQALYEDTYQPVEDDCTPNFIGWDSSYTDAPIAEHEMHQWLEATVSRVLEHSPRRLLEIGCGVGLVLQRLAPHCEEYVATDISSVAISRLRKYVQSNEDLRHVRLVPQAAVDFSGLSDKFDTIVLNSVIQYFPSVQYLLEVLRAACAHLLPGGRIFIGDVRHHGLLELFHASVQFARAGDEVTVERLRAAIDRGMRQEKELLVAPEFFYALPKWLPAVGGVEVLLKRGDAHNELNQYRYDVWLQVGAPAHRVSVSEVWYPEGEDLLAALEQRLSRHRPARLDVTDVPNARVSKEILLLRQLDGCDAATPWRDLRKQTEGLPVPGIHPEALWQLAERNHYDVSVTWSGANLGHLAATFVDRLADGGKTELVVQLDVVGDPCQYANDPLANSAQQALVRGLREHLRRRLPEHMLPSAMVVLPALPLTVNGKVDKDRLPPAEERPDVADYAEPRTDLQRALAGIFADVLRLDRVGLRDSFFELGGHSLLAMRVIAQLRANLAVELPLRAIFDHPTVAELGVEAAKRLRQPAADPALSLVPRSSHETIALSFAQERLWFLEQFGDLGAAYHVPLAYRVHGLLDVDALCGAVAELVQRHEMLRTRFVVEADEPHQAVDPPPVSVLEMLDLGDLGAAKAQLRVSQLLENEARHRTDLARGPLFRAVLVRLHDREHVLLLAAHHIAADGWSHVIMLRELSALYAARTEPACPALPAPVLQYADYAVWQRCWLQGTRISAQLDYWRGQLADAPEVLALPTDRPRPAVASFRGTLYRFELPTALAQRLSVFIHEEGVTSFMVLLAAFQILLARWSGGTDIVVGTPTAGRTHHDTEQLVGLFINTLVLRAHIDPQASFSTIVSQVKEIALAAYAHQDVPFEKVVAELKPHRDLSRQPIVQVIFALQNTPPAQLRLGSTRSERIDCPSSTSKYDLTLNVIESDGRLNAEIEYAIDLFDAGTIARIAGMYIALLDDAMARPSLAVSRLRLIAGSACTAVQAAPAARRNVCDLFLAQVARTPDAPALESPSSRLSYANLNSRANGLMRCLLQRSIGLGDVVAVVNDDGVDTFVAMLAVLKAGAAYLPVDAESPTDRLRYLFEDARPNMVMADASMLGRLPPTALPIVTFQSCIPDAEGEAAQDSTAPHCRPIATDLAYVIYTSGSTGVPKGVLVEHGGLHDLALAQIELFAIQPRSRLLQFASLSFDASVSEVFTAWCSGACLCLPGRAGLLAGDQLAAILNERKITHVTLPPSVVPGIVEAGGATTLETLVVAGEACTAAIARCMPSALRFVNAYGPTEATVCATAHLCDPQDLRDPPIGRPLVHAPVYVLDAELQRVPVGIAGELYIGGTGVARGYHGRSSLTAERFLADPFAGAGARMYRTGDRGRLRADGVIEFLGRTDRQIKVRGYRIEPGEVEAALLRDGRISQAFVTAGGELEGRSLVAYVVTVDQAAVSPEQLQAMVRAHLPAYMVPSTIVVVERFPLTMSGKIDQGALPNLPSAAPASAGTCPRTPTEKRLAAIWVEVLRCRSPDVHDSFFALGGHSLLATRTVTRIREAMNVDITLRDFFAATTLEKLAETIDSASSRIMRVPQLMPAARSNRMPLSYVQQSLWMLDRLGSAGSAYNMPITLRARSRIEITALQKTLDELVRRHESLRTRFVSDADGPCCVILPPQAVMLEVHDLRTMQRPVQQAETDRILDAQMRHRFDLRGGDLLRAVLMQLAEDEFLLSLVTHHIAADGWSVAVMVKELRALYASFAAGRVPMLREPALQYVDYSVWQRKRLADPAWSDYVRHACERLADAPMVFELPADHARPAKQSHQGALHRFRIPEPLHGALLELSAQRGITLYMTLLAAFHVLLSRLSGVTDILIGSPLAVRSETILHDVVGPLLNTVVLRLELADDPSFDDLLERARSATLDAHEQQQLPFEVLVEQLRPMRDLSRPPVVQVLFSMQNYPSPEDGSSALWERVESPWGYAKYDLSLYAEQTSDGLLCECEYATDLFEEATIDRWCARLVAILASMVADPAARISELTSRGEAERLPQLAKWSDTSGDALGADSLLDLIHRQAQQRPDAVAVASADRALNYGELDRRSTALAYRLWQMGAVGGERVGICMDRSVDLVVAILAVLKSGAAYVPLDPAYPQQRLEDMVHDSDLLCVLTDRATSARVPGSVGSASTLAIDQDCLAMVDIASPDFSSSRSHARTADSVAYVIYTSGSTGRPKGCVVTDRGLLNLLRALAETFRLGVNDRMLAVTPYSFDIAGLELLMPLLRGAQTHLCPAAHTRDAKLLMRTIREVRPTIMQATPATWQMLFRAGWRNETDLKILCGGEAMPDALSKQLACGGTAWNLYGPTETTIWSTVDPIIAESPVTIGKPLANTRVYVLDAAMAPVPIGVEGDLYIGGHGVARGYWNRPSLTSQRFLADPFSFGQVIYDTGDRARWREDGRLDFLGRRDAQVKLRGHRIELAEIEAVLGRHPAVDVCACALSRDGEPRLVAAYVPASDADATIDGGASHRRELQAFLRESLPDYMIPVDYIAVTALPLTANGKIDRAAVAALRGAAETPAQVAGHGDLVQRLVRLWRSVLDRHDVSLDEGFFEQGGTSLLAVTLAERIADEMQPGFDVTAIFEFGSIARIAAHIESLTASVTAPAMPMSAATSKTSSPDLTSVPDYYAGSVAVIGMSCTFPGAQNAEEFWSNLLRGKESIERISDAELRELGLSEDVLADPNYVPVRSALAERELFDAAFFNIPERDAQLMDPQLRLLLMHAWRAIEDAGYRVEDIKRTAVFATASNSAYHARLLAAAPASAQSIEQYVGWILAQNGTIPAVISNKLGLQGPSLFVHSNCSSSLSALDLARRRLLEGEWRFALVAAARVASFEGAGYVHQEGMNFSSDGHLRAFDADADGAVGGEGVAVLLLKRAHEAIADGDPIYAVLRATATNNDGGESAGFYAPSVAGQRAVIERALADSGIDPASISYVEAHGTGTPLGDPVEVAALSQAYGRHSNVRQFCGIGSVKTNIGHLDTAAGLAGCVKVALSLSRGEIPASLHFKTPNPALRLEQSPFFVVDTRRQWEGARPFRAAVSSMGVGGNNAHAIFEQCIARDRGDEEVQGPWLFPLSAHQPHCLRTLAQQLSVFVTGNPSLSLRSLAYTLQVGRVEMQHRLAIVASSFDELLALLRQYLDGNEGASGIYLGCAPNAPKLGANDAAAAELRRALGSWAVQDRYQTLSSLWVNGFTFDWHALYASGAPLRINAPTYPFDRRRFWLNAPIATSDARMQHTQQPSLFVERWDRQVSTRVEWNHRRYIVLCDVLPGSRLSQAFLTQASVRSGCVFRQWPRTAASLGVRFAAYACALLELVREAASTTPALIQFVVPGDEDGVVCAALSQLLLSAKREYDRLEVQTLCLSSAAPESAVAEFFDAPPLAARQMRCTDAAVCARRFVALPIQARRAGTPWRDGGRYLVTGGTGRLGMIVARAMAATLRCGTIVLAGRAKLSPVLADQVATLGSGARRVEYVRADVADHEQVRSLFDAMNERYGGIDGIVHAAGVLDDGYIARKQPAQLQGVLAPKVAGLENLDQCHGPAPLDFLICFGSIGGALGSAGQSDYAAANAFMRSFAEWRNTRVAKATRQGRTLCIDWPYWCEGGMQLGEQVAVEMAQAGLIPLSTQDGLAALNQAWESGASCVTVVAGDVNAIGAMLASADDLVQRATEAPPGVSSPDLAASNLPSLVLRRLTDVFSAVSKVDAARIGGSQPLETFSIDSIMIAQLNQRLAAVFPGLPKTLFYQFNSLADIRDCLVAEHTQACERWVSGLDSVNASTAKAREGSVAMATHAPVQRSTTGAREPIAIVGLAGRYPHACDLDAFWRNLRAGRDCIDSIPEQRWSLQGFYCEDPEAAVAQRMSYSKWGGFLDGFADFDPLFFGIPPVEAMDMDPQERLFLQACWEALENGNYTRQTLSRRHGGRVGVFAGITKTGFELHGRDLAERGDSATPYTSFSSVANRVSYLLDLNGPSLPIDTMCSASLTAIHEACEHLLRDECEMALAGGVNLYLHPSTYVGLCSQRMLSTDGRCRSFGANAGGFVPGEGVGVVLLKPLSLARRDGDTIHGVILASGINHGGRTHGYTVPNPRAQRDLVRTTLARAGIDAGDISYVEAHGTGTQMGDPIEIEGLSQAFATDALAPGRCALGSVKSNIGHLEAAAGIAGLTKVLLQFMHEELVPTLHSERINPNIDLTRTPFVLQHEVKPWQRPRRHDGSTVLRTATVSSFGAGGANAFLIVQEPAECAAPASSRVSLRIPGSPALIVLSARRADRLAEYAKRLLAVLEQGRFSEEDLPAIAATLQLGREAMEHRLAFVALSMADLVDGLRRCSRRQSPSPGTHVGQLAYGTAVDTPPQPLDAWMENSQYDALLGAWVAGATLDWASLYTRAPAMVSLPTYPFAQEWYWPVAAQSQPDRALQNSPPIDAFVSVQRAADTRSVAAGLCGAGLLVPDWEDIDAPDAEPSDGHVLVVNASDAQRYAASGWGAERVVAMQWSGRESFRRLLAGSAFVKVVWFAPPSVTPTFESLLREHAQAVQQCAELLQVLDDCGASINLIAVTRQGQSACADETPDPAHAAVAGFLRSAAKEYRHGSVAVADLEPGANPSIATLASLRAVVGRATVYAKRRVGWRRSRLTAVQMGAQRPDAPRREGVYIIVGGAGHVGQRITEHLIHEHRARVVWVGRRSAVDVGDGLCRFAEDQRPIYLQADANELASLLSVREMVLARYGRIDSVLLATTYFSIVPLRSLSGADLDRAFLAKVEPALNIAEAFGGDALDGLVFFSSLVSFIGNLGQSHYAAACAWQDGFARLLSSRMAMPAKVMNWGYWTTDDPQRTDKLREIGIDFIDAASGGQALDALLSGPLEQLGFLRTRRPLEVEGMNFGEVIRIDGERISRIPYAIPNVGDAPAGIMSANEPFALREFVHTTVSDALCNALRMDRASLDDRAMFADYGVDSITGLKVVRAINSALGIELPGPCLFDHPNLHRLTAHILADHVPRAPHVQPGNGAPATADSTTTSTSPSPAGPVAPRCEPIAIIGISGRFAQSDDVAELWRHLAAGRDLIEPAKRWPHSAWDKVDEEPSCRDAGLIREIDCFDPLFFRIARADAMHMDPQQRLCLEESWKALEAAGYVGRAIAGKRCGVYVGCSGEDYTQLLDGELPVAAMHGSSTALLSSRIAYHLDLRGPAMTVDTACSSGLVAVHLACQALWMDEIELAVAGGVHVQCTHWFHLIGSRAGMLSPDGRCFTFDERANGFVPSDGVGMVVLKKLSRALADGDHVVGVIAGSAINQDGTSNGLTAPSAIAQEQLALDVYDRFGVDVSQIQMAETHGTGTALGDPIEVNALTRAFRKHTDRVGYCALGSVKSNLGHAAEAAGLAGLFKVLLSLQHRQIPPTLHFRNGNPHIDFDASPFYVNTALRDWPQPTLGPRRAVLSSFGLSGTNAHMVIEEAAVVAPCQVPAQPWLLVLSARTPQQLRVSQERLLDHLRKWPELECMYLSYTLLQGRQHFDHRWACVATSVEQAIRALQDELVSAQVQGAAKPGASELDSLARQAERCIQAIGDADDRHSQLLRLGELFVCGCTPEFSALFGGNGRRIPLPTYPFARERYWHTDPPLDSATSTTVAVEKKRLVDVAADGGHVPVKALSEFIVDFLERALLLNPGELAVDTNVHDLGADSLVCMRLMREIAHRYHVKVSGRELFEHPSVTALVAHIGAQLQPEKSGAETAAMTAYALDALLDQFEAGALSIEAMEQLIEKGAVR